MHNPLVAVAQSELNKVGIRNAKLIRESYAPQDFGNAEAIYELGNLRLRLLRDRGDDTVQIGSSTSAENFYILDDVAIWMGWLSLDELLKYDVPLNFDEPPPGPMLSLSKALSHIKTDFSKLNKAFAADALMSTNAELKQIARQRTNTIAR